MKQQVDLGIWHRLSQLVVGLIVVAWLIGIFFWYLPVFQQNARLREQALKLEAQIKAEEAKEVRLKNSILNLKEDPKTLERLAREKLGYARPGETVIYFQPPREAAGL